MPGLMKGPSRRERITRFQIRFAHSQMFDAMLNREHQLPVSCYGPDTFVAAICPDADANKDPLVVILGPGDATLCQWPNETMA